MITTNKTAGTRGWDSRKRSQRKSLVGYLHTLYVESLGLILDPELGVILEQFQVSPKYLEKKKNARKQPRQALFCMLTSALY